MLGQHWTFVMFDIGNCFRKNWSDALGDENAESEPGRKGSHCRDHNVLRCLDRTRDHPFHLLTGLTDE